MVWWVRIHLVNFLADKAFIRMIISIATILTASLSPIVQPIASLLGGFLQRYIGRRYGIVLMNVCSIITWILLYEAFSVQMLYLSSILMGISLGFAGAPLVTYAGEIATPRWRGMLINFVVLNIVFGIMLTYLLASVTTNWRTLCLSRVGLCMFSVLLIAFVSSTWNWEFNIIC